MMAELLDQFINTTRAHLAGKAIEVRVHGHPAATWTTEDFTDTAGEFYPGGTYHLHATESTPWVPMAGWGVPQMLTIPVGGMFDVIEFREAGGEVLFATGVDRDRDNGQPVPLETGGMVLIWPAFHIEGIQVLPIPVNE
jgi:hypothetical protein